MNGRKSARLRHSHGGRDSNIPPRSWTSKPVTIPLPDDLEPFNQVVVGCYGRGDKKDLFLNLRGFSPTVWCRGCGESVRCPDCDISLTWHRDRAEAICHFCDLASPPPERCPRCGSPAVRYFGTPTRTVSGG